MAPSRREGTPADRAAEHRPDKRRYDEDRRRDGRERPERNGTLENGVSGEHRTGHKRKSDALEEERSNKRRRSFDRSPERQGDKRWSRGEEPPSAPRAQRGRGGGGGGGGGGRGGGGSGGAGRHHHQGQQRHDDYGGYGKSYSRGQDPNNHGSEDSKASDNPRTRLSAAWLPDIDVAEDDEQLKEVQLIMGFAGFKSTNNKQVPGNDTYYGVKKEKQTQYRQYMNRVGGFNRPLSPPKD